MLDPAGVTRTKALGTERMARKLRDALPGGDGALRAAVWEFMRPMLSPALVELNRDAFVIEDATRRPSTSTASTPSPASTSCTSMRPKRTETPRRPDHLNLALARKASVAAGESTLPRTIFCVPGVDPYVR